jgi:nicotinamide-nucleotide amidase
MFQGFSKDYLVSRSGECRTFCRVIVVTGRSESDVEMAVQPVYARWLNSSPTVFTSILASLGKVELHLSTIGANVEASEQALTSAVAAISDVLGASLVSTDGSPIEVVVGRLLKERDAYLAVAESCTGGLTSSRLTDVPGSSDYLHSGWVAYSDEAKIKALGIDCRLIKKYGAVSKEVAEAMAMSAYELAGVQYALGITGIAGPVGGSAEKPVGMVWIALVGQNSLRQTRLLRLSGERADIKYQASQEALDLLRRALLQCV